MTAVLNTNLASLRAQRALASSVASQAQTVARLSSGRRINSASDDAAGLAISDRMTAQIRGLGVASRNTQDGISLAQTADGSLGSIAANLQRLREPAVQSANGTNSSGDRAALQLEANQLVSEIDRVTAQTSFNGVKLLDGTFVAQSFQVGAGSEVGQHITVASLPSLRTGVLGMTPGTPLPPVVATTTVAGTGLSAAGVIDGAGQLVINGVDVYQGTPVAADASRIVAAINAAGIGGLTATAAPNVVVGSYVPGVTGSIDYFQINGVGCSVYISGNRNSDINSIVGLFNGVLGPYFGLDMTASDNGNGVTLVSSDGGNIVFNSAGGAATCGLGGLPGDGSGTPVITYAGYSVSYTGSAGLSISGTRAAALGLTPVTPPPPPTSGGTSALAQLDISTVAGANAALGSLDVAIDTVDAERATLGATQNRLRSVLGNIDVTAQNASASRSRIVDADYAGEATSLARSQILQSAGLAMVAQANSSPRWVLALLK